MPNDFVDSIVIIRRIILSLFAGLDSATSSASAAKPTSLLTGEPSASSKRLLRCRKSTNRKAALRLLPSENGCFLMVKYSKCAALIPHWGKRVRQTHFVLNYPAAKPAHRHDHVQNKIVASTRLISSSLNLSSALCASSMTGKHSPCWACGLISSPSS